MDRKKFIKQTVVTALGLPLIAAAACSDDSNATGPGGGNCITNGTNVNIGSNHGHSLQVSASDVQAASQKTYSIQGSSGHDHTVTISASDFQALKQNNSISVNSASVDGHSHNITVSCA